jgi:hypothetical protein
VDGSCILALPTDEPFEGGALHVWDGKPKQAPKSGDDINMMKHEYIYIHTHIYIYIYIWGFPKTWTSKNGWFISGKSSYKWMDDLRVPPFQETSIYIYIYIVYIH